MVKDLFYFRRDSEIVNAFTVSVGVGNIANFHVDIGEPFFEFFEDGAHSGGNAIWRISRSEVFFE